MESRGQRSGTYAGRWRADNETDAWQPIHVAAVQVAKISEVGQL